jgi:hypothetical protein
MELFIIIPIGFGIGWALIWIVLKVRAHHLALKKTVLDEAVA